MRAELTRAHAIAGALMFALTCGMAGCGGSTGNDHVQFAAEAAGPTDANGGPLSFTTPSGWNVTLAKAQLHIGGIYLNATVPLSGRQAAGCYLSGTYVGQVLGGLDVDLLSPVPAPFPVAGDGLAIDAHVAEVWLTGGAIDADDDTTVIFEAAGTAEQGGVAIPFEAALTIGKNRLIPSSDPALPSLHPICLERIVTPIPVDLTPAEGRTLSLRVDPRGLFLGVDFSVLPAPTAPGGVRRFDDAPTNNADIRLYKALHATSGVYQLTFE